MDTPMKRKLLETTLSQVNEIAIQMTGTEMSLRLLNDDVQQDELTRADNRTLVGKTAIKYHGKTPLGTQLERRVINPILLDPTREKPIITILITDGEVCTMFSFHSIDCCSTRLLRTPSLTFICNLFSRKAKHETRCRKS
ncbi:uncharacterized protein BDV17DRAFT_252896 [Aspergillus undulatus]|uniref:uncharacterized protein n=1 Tax=Aspergillus undulatus TaxID=1810928 RepID=UPI003CCE2DD6